MNMNDVTLNTQSYYTWKVDTSNLTSYFNVDPNIQISGNVHLQKDPYSSSGTIITAGSFGGSGPGGGNVLYTDDLPAGSEAYYIATFWVYGALQGYWVTYTAPAKYLHFTTLNYDGYFAASGGNTNVYWSRYSYTASTWYNMFGWWGGGAYTPNNVATYNHLNGAFDINSFTYSGGQWQTQFRMEYQNGGFSWYPVGACHGTSRPYYYWDEYRDSGVIQSSSDIDFGSTKRLNNITINGLSTPGDGDRGYTGYTLEMKVFYGGIWSEWIPVTSGQNIGTAAQKVQLRLTLSTDQPYNYYTPSFDSINVNYEDPPSDQPPLFSFPQVDPSPVGYKDNANVSVIIESFTPLIEAYVNWTNNSWANWYRVNISDTLNISSNTRWHGFIDPQPIGTTVEYYFNATNRFYNESLPGWQSFTANTTNYSYTTIDRYPPNITHDNNSLAWNIGVSNLHPYPSVTSLKINCLVQDEVTPVIQGDVFLLYNTTGTWNNVTMTRNATTQHFYYTINYVPSTVITNNDGIIHYYIEAKDQNATGPNIGFSDNFTITIDNQGPTVTNIYIDPNRRQPGDITDVVEYSDTVNVFCNITDVNPLGTLELVWSATNFVTNSSPINLIYYAGTGYKTQIKIPNQAYGTTVKYAIRVEDTYGNHREYVGQYYVDDFTPPEIVSIIQSPNKLAVGAETRVTVTVNVFESALGSGMSVVYLQYIVNSNTSQVYTILMETSDNEVYTASIPKFPIGTNIQYAIIAFDVAGNNVISPVQSYNVVDIGVFIDPAVMVLYSLLIIGPLSVFGVGSMIYYYKPKFTGGEKGSKYVFYGGASSLAIIPVGIGILGALQITPVNLSGLSLEEFLAETTISTPALIWVFVIATIVIVLASIGLVFMFRKFRKNRFMKTKRISLKKYNFKHR